jgi:hypothetical protein
VVIVLAIGHKVCGFKPGRERWILTAIKSRNTNSFGREVSLSDPWRNILRHAKETCWAWKIFCRRKSLPFPRQLSPACEISSFHGGEYDV